MEKKEKHFVEQDAPLKNTDKAFVKVDRDGSASMPATNPQEKTKKTGKDDTPGKSRR